MNRISGIEKSQAPWHLRWFYTTMRKMFGKDLTPVKQQMRLPGMVFGFDHGAGKVVGESGGGGGAYAIRSPAQAA